MKNRQATTFWQGQMPPYLEAVQSTWARAGLSPLILDYSNWDSYLGDIVPLDESITTLPLAMQSDIASAIYLFKYGGLFLDCDTIITSTKWRSFVTRDKNSLLAFGRPSIGSIHVAVLYAHAGALATRLWVAQILQRLKDLDREQIPPTGLANGILEPAHSKGFINLKIKDRTESQNIPEANYVTESRSALQAYRSFWFGRGCSNEEMCELSSAKFGMISLHNSWTPKNVVQMSSVEFLESNLCLASFLKFLVNGKTKLCPT